MAPAAPPRVAAALRASSVPLLVLTISVALTVALVAQLKRTIDAQDQERFDVAVDRLQDGIRDRLNLYVAMLRAGAGLFAAAEVQTPRQFGAFVAKLQVQERYPGIQGIGYSARVSSSDLEAFETAQRRLVAPQFRVWPEHSRDEYHAIVFLEPLDRRNQAAIGYDMLSEPTRRAAMERARDSGEPAASGVVTLVQEIDADKQPGFLIYMPVYNGDSVPGTVAERRAALRGFVYSPFRAVDLFSGTLGSSRRQTVGFQLYDGAPGRANLLYSSPTPQDSGRFRTTRSIDVAGRAFTAVVFSTPWLDDTSSRRFLPFALASGLAVSALLALLALLQTRARWRAEESEAAAADASRQFQQLANSIPQLAWMARPDGWIYWYNDRWYDYTGTTPADMAGWGWQQVHDPEVLPRVLDRWRHSIGTGEPFEMEFPLRAADGTFRLFLTRVVPFRDSSGAIAQWFGTNTDVQYRREAEQALQEQAETLEVINTSGAQLAAELNLDRLVQSLTDTGTRLVKAKFGAFFYNVASEQGEAYTLYTLSGVPREAFAGFAMPRNTAVFGPTFRGEAIIRSDDITKDPRYGRNAPYRGMPPGHLPVRSYLAVPVRSRSGEVLGGLFFAHPDAGVFTDQAEHIAVGLAAQAAVAIDNARLYGEVQRLLERERAAREEAERVSRMKDEFLATLSHELRTPLNAVLGWAHMLVENTLPAEKKRHALASVLRNARIQSRLIEDLLDMSRIISGRVRIDTAAVDLRAVVDAALDAVRPAASAKGVALAFAHDDGYYEVRGDSHRLQQVAWNLLTNAIKFTPQGGEVNIALRRSEGDVELSVSDNGIGIAPEFLPHVFDRFRQADASATRGHGGLGLGLSIARGLVEMHGGTVAAASGGLGSGATFTVRLPKAAATDRADARADAGTTQTPMSGGSLTDVPVLVVDDDTDSRELAAEILRHEGAAVHTAASAREALERLDSGRGVALVVSDIGMPQMDGYALVRQLRTLPPERGGRAGAIALTAYAGAEEESRAIAAGYDLHLPKPYAPADLVNAAILLVRRRDSSADPVARSGSTE